MLAAEQRLDLLCSLDAEAAEVEELEVYTRNHFSLEAVSSDLNLPLPDELFVEAWKEYAGEAAQYGALPVLRERLVQLHFPIQAGISRTREYAAATRKGRLPEGKGQGLRLIAPERLHISVHSSAAGRIPVLVIGERADFVALVRALACHNEPAPIPDSLGSLMLSGYNNWDRIARLRRHFKVGELAIPGATDWNAAFAHIRQRRDLYQDRLLLLGPGPYSGVCAAKLGLPEGVWERLSLIIRLEHESAHYLTRRLLNSMRNNLLDELVADYAAIVAAAGKFIRDWLLYFMGLEDPQCFRPGGRLENYRGDPPLSDGAFRILQRLARCACRNLEAADRTLVAEDRCAAGRCRMILALARLSLEELANEGADERIRAQFTATKVRWVSSPDSVQNGSSLLKAPVTDGL